MRNRLCFPLMMAGAVAAMLSLSSLAAGAVPAASAASAAASATAATAAATAAAPASSLLPARVMKAANDRVGAGEYPMLVIGVVDGDESKLYGFNAEGDPVPNADTVFEIGSVTKTFTGLALAEAVKAGKVSLDEPVAKLLPKFTIPSRNGKKITLGNLADQYSGLPRLPGNLEPWKNPANPYEGYGTKKLKAFLASYELPRDPGSSFEYSNLGFGLLGYALAQNAGVSYGELMKKNILEPLQMNSCGITIDKTMRKHLAAGHDSSGKPTANWDMDVLTGAGGLKCSAADMLTYLKVNMGLLKSPLYPAMQLAHESRAAGPGANRVGLGWMTLDAGDQKVIWHNGMTGGYASFIGFTADGKHGVVVLTNIQQSVDDLGLATLLPDAALAPVQATIAMSPRELDAYAGYYQMAPNFLLVVFRDDDQLYAQATGQGALPIYPSAKDEFFAKDADISISFLRGNKGKLVGLILHQHGNTPAKKVDAAEAAQAIGKLIKPLGVKTLKQYVGQYQLTPDRLFDVTLKKDRLYLQLTGQSPIPIYPSAKDRFFAIVVKADIVFERGKDGKVNALVLHQNGATQNAPRVTKKH